MNLEDLNILFLAQFAPNEGEDYPLTTEETDGIYAQYHYDIYKILKSICPKTKCAHDVEILIKQKNRFDYVFTLLNRASYRNSEIFVSALLEYLKLPYLGSKPNIRSLAEDKHLAKIVAKHCGLDTPDWITIDFDSAIPHILSFDGPYFIKPRFGASSKYIDESSIAYDWTQACNKIRQLQNEQIDIIVEKFVDGKYYSVPIYYKDGKAIHLTSIQETSILEGNVVTYRQKRKLEPGLTRTINDNIILENELTILADKFLSAVMPLDYTRIDFIVTSSTIEFIEFNICCNLGAQSSFCLAANNIGLSQTELVTQIFSNSLKRQKII